MGGSCGTNRDGLLGARALALSSLIAALPAACQGSAKLRDDGGPVTDTSGDVASVANDASDAKDASATHDATGDIPCRGALDAQPPFGPCTETFADTGWVATECRSLFLTSVWEQTCGGYQMRRFSYATHTKACYYDPASGALLAADFADDVNTFCGHTVWRLILGDIPAPVSCTPPTLLPYPCSFADAGTI